MFKYSVFIVAFLSIHLCVGEFFDDVGVRPTDCEEKCTKSYPPHTYSKPSDHQSCQRGCRLYVIGSLVSADDVNATKNNKENCHNYCIEAYNGTSSETMSCKSGCDSQHLNSEKELKSEDDTNFHLLKPLMQVREVASKVVGMFHIMKTSVTTYFMGDNDKVVAVRGPVEVVVDMMPPKEQEEPPNYQLMHEGDSAGPNEFLAKEEIDTTHQSYSSYFLLSFITFMGLLSLTFIFLICSRETPKKSVRMSVPLGAAPIKLVRPEDLTKLSLIDEELGDAGPLPMKVKLPDSTI